VRTILLAFVALVLLVVVFDGFFIISEGSQGLVTQFGKPVGGVKEPGLHFKIPFVQNVHRFESRILKWDGDPNQIPTRDKRYIWIDTTARWRIADPLRFYMSVATVQGAAGRLDDIIDSVARDAVSGHLLVELVRGSDYRGPLSAEGAEVELPPDITKLRGREEILGDILAQARNSMPEYGIELIDVQIKRINYVEQVRLRVYERMISERKKVAAEFRSEGEGQRAEILGQMQKELKRIESDAQRESLEIRGKGDAEAARIFADAYNRDPAFYAFHRSLETYRRSLQKNHRLVLSTESDLYRFLRKMD
jgi:modulator of FtsH protease HflC